MSSHEQDPGHYHRATAMIAMGAAYIALSTGLVVQAAREVSGTATTRIDLYGNTFNDDPHAASRELQLAAKLDTQNTTAAFEGSLALGGLLAGGWLVRTGRQQRNPVQSQLEVPVEPWRRRVISPANARRDKRLYMYLRTQDR